MKTDQVLKRPIITEKSLSLASSGKYTFKVDGKANKREIARAVEETFGVHVRNVRTITIQGKKRRTGSRRKISTTSSITKAIVQLLPEEKIDLFTTGTGEEEKK